MDPGCARWEPRVSAAREQGELEMRAVDALIQQKTCWFERNSRS